MFDFRETAYPFPYIEVLNALIRADFSLIFYQIYHLLCLKKSQFSYRAPAVILLN